MIKPKNSPIILCHGPLKVSEFPNGPVFVQLAGGGGVVLYATNVVIPSGTYTIKVGAGGAQNTNGYSSEAFGAICLGGGSTAHVGWNTPNDGSSGSGSSSGSDSDSCSDSDSDDDSNVIVV